MGHPRRRVARDPLTDDELRALRFAKHRRALTFEERVRLQKLRSLARQHKPT